MKYQTEIIPVGIYEKALPLNISIREKLKLAAEAGFDFVELSIDESDERLARLDWSDAERREFRKVLDDAPIPIFDICLSAHRKFALGSADSSIRKQAFDIMSKAIDFGAACGIRIIQLAGYYVYYEPETPDSIKLYEEGLHFGLERAEKAGVMLGLENVDGTHVNSVSVAMDFVNKFNSPWFHVYPDIGNLTEQGLDVKSQLEIGRGHIVAVHVKDVKKGQVRRIPFGDGLVDFDRAFQTLAEMQFAGPVLIEMWNDDSPDTVKIIKNALHFIKQGMKKNGLSV